MNKSREKSVVEIWRKRKNEIIVWKSGKVNLLEKYIELFCNIECLIEICDYRFEVSLIGMVV